MNRYTINKDRLRIIGPNDTEKKNFNGVLASIKAIHPNSNVWKRSMKSLKREWALRNALHPNKIACDLKFPERWSWFYNIAGAIAEWFIK